MPSNPKLDEIAEQWAPWHAVGCDSTEVGGQQALECVCGRQARLGTFRAALAGAVAEERKALPGKPEGA
jgi:hypothetical protein